MLKYQLLDLQHFFKFTRQFERWGYYKIRSSMREGFGSYK